MGQNTFESKNGWSELKYPTHWSQFEEDDGTYLFMDNEDWKGNLRITAMRYETTHKKEQPEKVRKRIADELNTRDNATLIKLADKEAVYYLKMVEEDGDSLLIHNWTIGDKGTLFICSFAIDNDKANDENIKRELNFAIKTFESIQVR